MPNDNTPAHFRCNSQTRCYPLLPRSLNQHLPGDEHEHGEIDRHEHAEWVCVVNVHLWSAGVRRRRDQRLQSHARRMRNQHLLMLWFVDRTLLNTSCCSPVVPGVGVSDCAQYDGAYRHSTTRAKRGWIQRKTTTAPRSHPPNRAFVACCRLSSILRQVHATNENKIQSATRKQPSKPLHDRLRSSRCKTTLTHSPAVSRPSDASRPWRSSCPS